MSDSPRVSVVIPARDAAATLRTAVTSALAQDGADPLDVVVAVGPSRDATRAMAADLANGDPRVTVVDAGPGGTPGALNAAIRASQGDVIIRLDAHAELPPGYVSTALEVLRATDAGNVGGRQVPLAQHGFAAAVAAAMRSPLGSGGAMYRSGKAAGPAETVYLGVFRREALDAVGGFDERLLRNQDYELNHRLRKAGWLVWFDPRLEVAYRPRGSVRSLARQYFDYGRFKRVVIRAHPSSIRPRQLAPLAMAAGVVGAGVVGVMTSSRWLPIVVAGGYVGLVAAGGAIADRRRAPQVALALATIHWSWAAGFCVGPPWPSGGQRAAGRSTLDWEPDRSSTRS